MILQLTSPPALPTSLPSASPQGSPSVLGGGPETINAFDEKGFPTTIIRPAAEATEVKHYNEQGFLVTDSPAKATPTFRLVAESASPSIKATTAPTNAAANLGRFDSKLGAVCAILLGGVLAL